MPTVEVNSLRSREEDMSQYYVNMSKLDMQPEKSALRQVKSAIPQHGWKTL